ncbi:MAG: DNA cytosine methyltransferase, partial [Bdellovibrionota bacterium]
MKSVELFAGAGGLAIGTALAGFKHEAVVEWDHDACNTIRENQGRGLPLVKAWSLHETDVSNFDYRAISAGIDLLSGGPPCQPFSMGGKHRGDSDKRNLFPEVFRAARELRPRAILVENVKGLTRPSFAEFFKYIELQLGSPEFLPRKGEDWSDHLTRLKKHHPSSARKDLKYNVQYRVLNAANYGVPQKRERVIFVAFRSDLPVEWNFPFPTHSLDAMLWQQWVTGEYWERHGVAKSKRPNVPMKFASRVEGLRNSLLAPAERPWVTVRDALAGLPDPEKKGSMETFLNHKFNPGARPYPGHTGSPLDEPGNTLKAGDHGVPGGENMLAHPDGRVRYFTVRESARLQTFPDDYAFEGAWSEAMRQLGNA